jgi:hypothetical protein
MNAEALEAFLLAKKLEGQSEELLRELRQAYAKSGWRGYHLVELQRAKARWNGWHVDAHNIASLSLAVGDTKGALDWLERCFQARSGTLVWIPSNAEFHRLDKEPRYQQLMNKLNLSPDVVRRT